MTGFARASLHRAELISNCLRASRSESRPGSTDFRGAPWPPQWGRSAIARVRGASVVTRNVAHFEGVGVAIVNPWDE
jgi:hypothetical protein